MAALRALPLHLPYPVLLQLTSSADHTADHSVGHTADHSADRLAGEAREPQPRVAAASFDGGRSTGLFPRAADEVPLPRDLRLRWRSLAARAPGKGPGVRARAALILALNHRAAAAARFIAWDETACSSDGDGSSGDADGLTPSPADLARANVCRLLGRTKLLVVALACAATTPSRHSDCLAPTVAWEMLRGSAAPPVLAPPEALAQARSSKSEATECDAATSAEGDDLASGAAGTGAKSALVVPLERVRHASPGQALGHGTAGHAAEGEASAASASAPAAPALALHVRSAEYFARHHATGVGLGAGDPRATLRESALGQLLRRLSDLAPCDLRHQATRPETRPETWQDGSTATIDPTDPATRAAAAPVGFSVLLELQPRSLHVVLVTALCPAAPTTTPMTQAALWRALLFACCRDAQGGGAPLFAGPDGGPDGGPGGDPDGAAFDVNPRFLAGDCAGDAASARACHMAWFFGFGQVLGLALRTGLKLPLRLTNRLWAALAAALFPGAPLPDPGVSSLLASALASAPVSCAEGLASVVPRGALGLLSGADLEAALCLPPAATNATHAMWRARGDRP